MKSFLYGLLAVTLVSLIKPDLSLAQYYSQSEGQLSLVIDKFVRPINDVAFYDNIGVEKRVFAEGDEIEYKLVVKNAGSEKLTSIRVVDYLPANLTLLFFPGSYDKSGKEVGFVIDSLAVGEAKEYLIRARLTDLARTNYAMRVTLSNKACAKTEDVSDCDTSTIYANSVLIPSTGVADMTVKTLVALGVVGVALLVRKKIRGY